MGQGYYRFIPLGAKIKAVCRQCGGEFTYANTKGPTRFYCSTTCKSKAGVLHYNKVKSWKKKGVLNQDGTVFTVTDRDRMYQLQQGRCAICKRHETDPIFRGKALVVDHNHSTGIVRSLLCQRCNVCIGWIESFEFWSTATTYIDAFKAVA